MFFANCNLLKMIVIMFLKTSELKMVEMFTIINNVKVLNIYNKKRMLKLRKNMKCLINKDYLDRENVFSYLQHIKQLKQQFFKIKKKFKQRELEIFLIRFFFFVF